MYNVTYIKYLGTLVASNSFCAVCSKAFHDFLCIDLIKTVSPCFKKTIKKFTIPCLLPIAATLLRLYRQKRREGAKPSIKKYGSFTSAASSGLAHFSVMELTRDHHPDRDDERARVESAGGYVLEWAGVSRVNGELAVSRALGDVPFKRCCTIRTKYYATFLSALTQN